MRIVDRDTFLAMPEGTVFARFARQSADRAATQLDFEGELSIKGETHGAAVAVQSLIPSFEGVLDSGAWLGVLVDMIGGKASPPVDYESARREECDDAEQLFAVWSPDDVERLIARLQRALADARRG